MQSVCPDRPSVMIDPSLALSDQGLEWMEINLERGVELVVPMVVTHWIEGNDGIDPGLVLAPEDLESFDLRLAVLRERAPDLRGFDHKGVDLDEDARAALDRLLATDIPAASVWADEWAYLQSNSWLTSKLRLCLDAFESAGVVVVEFGREVGIELIEQVIPADHLPDSIDGEVILRATVKWIVVGGAHALGGTVGGIAGAGVGGPVGAVIGEKVGGFAGKALARKAVLAVDP